MITIVASEAVLVSTIAKMVISGVSSRKVSNVMETSCGTSYPKSTVSEACKKIDSTVKEYKSRPLEGCYHFL